MQRRQLVILVAALMSLTTLAVFAQDQGRGNRGQFDPAAWFARCDANADGTVTRDEFQGNDAMFTRLDANGDGAIVRDELGAMQGDRPRPRAEREGGQRFGDPAQRWQMMLQRFDQDRDGKLTAEEFQGAPRIFTMLDQDGDGVLTEEEGTRVRAGGGDQGAGPGRGGFTFEALARNADRDGDGKVSADEWPGRPGMFQRLDTDGDGFMTAEEGRQIGQQLGAGRGDRADVGQIFIRMLDKNGDGQVSNSEWTDWFGGADENEDGLLSHAELTKKLQETMRRAPQPAVEE